MKATLLRWPVLCVLLTARLPAAPAGYQPPQVINQVKPDYPDALRNAGIAGVVIVQFGVDASGAVENASIFKSDHAELSDLALNAVKQWTFKPAMKDGHAVATPVIQIPLTFALEATPFRAYPSLDAAFKLAAEQHKVVLIDFCATWCEPCKLLDRTTWKDPSVIALLNEKALSMKIDAEKNAELAAHFNVTAYPTTVVIRPDRTVIDSLVGYRDAPTFTAEFNGLLSGKSQVDQARDAVARAGTDPEELAKTRFALGRLLAQKGNDAEALDQFLWCFDIGMKQAPSFGGVRTSFLVSDLAALASHYPPAQQALAARKDADRSRLEDPILAGEFASLNHALGDDKATLAAFDSFPKASAGRQSLGYWLFDMLLESKRYGDAVEAVPVARFKEQFDAMRAAESRSPGIHGYLVTAGTKQVEAQAGAGQLDEARGLVQMLLKYDHSDSTITALREHLVRAGHPELLPQPPAVTKT
jgi:TonB family protein